MHDNIRKACQAIVEPEGDQLLSLLRKMYDGADGKKIIQSIPEYILDRGSELDLLDYSSGEVVLTTFGWRVSNAAKEYCNWLDCNRLMSPPCPPEQFVAGKDVLDLGCGIGRWLWEFQTHARSAVGLEMQQEFIELGTALSHREGIAAPRIYQGSAEALDVYVPPSSIDFVFSRLMFNHVAIRKTLRQVVDVLRSQGIIWLQVKTFSRTLREFTKEKRFRSKAFTMFGILNSVLYMTTHIQMSLSAKGRMHSVHKPVYPSLRCWKTTFAAVGLRDFHLTYDSGGTLAFWARKP